MYRFTAEGRRLADSPCLMTGRKHEPEPVAAQQDTFFCQRCGAIPKDSIWYDIDGEPDDTNQRGLLREDDRHLPRL